MKQILLIGSLGFLLTITGCTGLLIDLLKPDYDNLAICDDFRPDSRFGYEQAGQTPAKSCGATDIGKIEGVVWLELVIGPKSNMVGCASGFMVPYAGKPHILSAGHICQGAKYLAIYAYFSQGQKEPEEVEIIAADKLLDVALLRFKNPKFEYKGKYPRIGRSAGLNKGERVFPLGSPFGFDFLVREGVINKLNFGLNYPGITQPQLILHDATINPGDSGGPLFNEFGEIIGMNVLGINPYWIVRSTATTISGAIPIDDIKLALRNLQKSGYAEHAYIGWKLYPTDGLNPLNYKDKKLVPPEKPGLMVYEICPDSPAEKAGLKVGDILLEYDNRVPNNYNEVARYILFERRPGDELTVRVYREEYGAYWKMEYDDKGYPFIRWYATKEKKTLSLKVNLAKKN